jgi:hypothetical protein
MGERPARTEATARPTSGDVSFPAYVTATTGVVLWLGDRLAGDAGLPPEVYVWVQLTVPLLMGRAAAAWRVRRAGRQDMQEGPDAGASGP